MEQIKLMLRPVEVAEVLGIGRSKVYELLASGEIPCVRLGTKSGKGRGAMIRVPVDALREWVERSTLNAERNASL